MRQLFVRYNGVNETAKRDGKRPAQIERKVSRIRLRTGPGPEPPEDGETLRCLDGIRTGIPLRDFRYALASPFHLTSYGVNQDTESFRTGTHEAPNRLATKAAPLSGSEADRTKSAPP